MSMEHVDHLLSRAYDGDLAADQRALFDGHLSFCAACSAAYADLATGVDAVRGLPAVRMPHPVLLPEGLPRGAARRWPWSRGAAPAPSGAGEGPRRWAALPLRHPWVSGLLGAAATAALVAAVVVPTTLGHGPASGLRLPVLAPSSGAAGSYAREAVPQGSIPAAPCGGCSAATACPAPLAPTGAPLSTAIPAIYNNRAASDDGVTTAIVATSVSTYAPGQTVEIYARLVDDRSGAVTLPCTFLGPASAAGSHSLSGPFSGAASPEVPATLGLEGQGILEATVPASAPAGETLDIVIDVPAARGKPAHAVALPITVG
jgi:hypothetical protein